jgi:hypothetical protein
VKTLKVKAPAQGMNKFKNWNFLVILVFWILGIRTILQTKAAVAPDSGGYLVGNTSTSWGNISFTGESSRAWPTLLFYSITNSLDSKIFLQTVLYLFAVSFFLLVTVARNRNTLSVVTTLLICILFLSNNTFQWNAAILAESTTLSFTLIGLTFYILTAIRTDHSAIFLVSGTFFLALASLVRAQLLISMVIIVFGLVILKKNKVLSYVGIFTVLVTFGYVSYVNTNINETWGTGSSQATRNTVSYYFLTATETKNDSLTTRLFQSLPPDAPQCLKSEESRAPFVSAPGPYVFQSQQYLRCALGVQWLNENFFSFYSKFLLQNPIQIFESSRTYLPDSISAIKYAEVKGPIPSWIEDFWKTGSNGGVDTTPFYSWIFLSMFRILSQVRKGGDIRLFTLSSIWLGMFISLVVTYLFMNAETSRIAVSSVYPLIAIAIVIIFNFPDKKARIKNGKRSI